MKRRILSTTISFVLAFSTLVPTTILFTNSVNATLDECVSAGAGSVCAFTSTKDSSDGLTNDWNPDVTNAPEDVATGSVLLYFFNWTGNTYQNLTLDLDLPAGLSYDPTGYFEVNVDGTQTNAYTANDFIGSGVNVGDAAPGFSVQVTIPLVTEEGLANRPGDFDYTVTGNYTSSNGLNVSNSADLNFTLNELTQPVNPSDIHINEVVCQPRSDWSYNNDYRLAGRGVINNDDQYIELYIAKNGLDLTEANWTLEIDNNAGADGTTQVLSTGTSYQYIALGGGSVTDTRLGDFVLLNNPVTDLTCNLTLTLDYDTVVVDEVSLNYTNTDVSDESIGRDENSTDTDNDFSDFIDNVGTPGRANVQPEDDIFEAEDENESNDGDPTGVDTDNLPCGDLGVMLESGLDNSGHVIQATSNGQNAAGAYRVSLYLSTINANTSSMSEFGDFYVTYTDQGGTDRRIGYRIKGKDMVNGNDDCRTFTFDMYKPATSNTTYNFEYFNTGGTDIIVDRIEVDPISTNNINFPKVYQAEGNQSILGTGNRVTGAVYSPAANGAGRVFYGPYSADMHTGLNANFYEATFRMRFENISGNATDPVVMIDALNGTSVKRESVLRVENVSGSWADYTIKFPAGYQGSFEFRAFTYGNADVYIDSVTVNPVSRDGVRYEAENDFETWNGSSILVNNMASGNMERRSTLAGNGTGRVVIGPYVYDHTGTNEYYEATFRIRSNGVSNDQNNAAYIIIRDFDTAQVYEVGHVNASLLGTDYRDFKLIFKSPAALGRLAYEVDTTDIVDVYVDYVEVRSLGVNNPLPRTIQIEDQNRWTSLAGVIEHDAQATNNHGVTGGYAIRLDGTTDADNIVIYSDKQEFFDAGTYDATFRIKRDGINPSSNNTILLEVWNESSRFGFIEVAEDAIPTSGYGTFTVPNINVVGTSRIYFKIFYYGSSTNNDLLLDSVVLNLQ